MSFGKLLATAMESVEEDNAALLSEVAGDPVQEVAVETPEEAAQSTAQVEESYATVDQAMEAIDEALGSAQTLDKIADSMEKIEASGGMDENMAAVAEVAIESLYKKLGVKKSALLAMETYSSEQTRKSATGLALENIQETAKKVWQAILNMLKQAYEFVKSFFKALFDKNAKMVFVAKSKLAALKKFRSDNNVDDSISDSKIVNNLLASELTIDGKVDFSTIKDGFDSLKIFLNSAKETTDGLKNHLGLMHEFLIKITEKDLNNNFPLPNLEKLGWKKHTDNLYIFDGVVKVGFGDHHLEIDSGIVNSSKDAIDSADLDRFTVQLFSRKQEAAPKSLSVLSLDEIQKTLEFIIEACASVEKSKSVIVELEGIQKSLEREAELLLKGVESIEGFAQEEVAGFRIAKKAITVISKLSIRINTLVSKYAITSSGNVLHYVDLCMKEHKITTEAPVSA